MKKWMVLVTALVMCLALLGYAAAEDVEEMGEGTVQFFDNAPATETTEEPTQVETMVPDNVDRAIIGRDDRITISNVKEFPYSAIAYLDVQAECGCRWTASGFVGGKPDVIITAAHCLVCTDHGKWADRLNIYFGYKSKSNYMYKYSGGWEAWVGNIFPNHEYSIDNDWGVIKVNENIAGKVGGFGTVFGMSDQETKSTHVVVAGYRDAKLRKDSGYLEILDKDHTYFYMDEVSGNSGGPIFTEDGYAVGIIIAENVKNGVGIFNVGYRLTGEIWNKIHELSSY